MGKDSKKKQRKTRDLGLNRSSDKPKIYDYIEKVMGIKEKYCYRGTSKSKSKYGFEHLGPNPLPIRKFNLLKAYINSKGEVMVKSKDGLQAYCIECERKYRRGRLNRWSGIYSKLTEKQVYERYKKEYGKTCRCSRCNTWKKPEEFSISRKMDKGLHNVCKSCSKTYGEAVGNRWAIYSPDGHTKEKPEEGSTCVICGAKRKLHVDHIWPISKGGTDHRENTQVLCSDCNLSKSATISSSLTMKRITPRMVCERYHDILFKAKKYGWSVAKFEMTISKAVRDFIRKKQRMSDDELFAFFESEKVRNNRKHSSSRAVRKFREFCGVALLEIDKLLSD